MRSVALSSGLLALALLVAASDEPKPTFTPTAVRSVFIEQFAKGWDSRWTPSEATKKTPVGGEIFSYVGEWKVEEPAASLIEGDTGLVAKTKAAHHAISAPLAKPFDFKVQPLVIQYEVQYQKGGNCGGGYLKLLEDGFQTNQKEFSDQTPWVVMFGPDLTCPGTKVHFIFRHKNPVTGEYEEKHLRSPPMPSIDKSPKLYTLVVNPDNTFEIFIDGESLKQGSLLEEFSPAVNPPKEIDDPADVKPADWVDTKRIADPEAVKPEDWDEDAPYEIIDEAAEKPEGWLDDEPVTIPDPDSEKPEEWDDEEDGDWISPTVPNPKCTEAPGCGEWQRPKKPNPFYKGKWFAPMIDNPEYKGEWAPRQIANPEYFEDLDPIKSLEKIGGIGIELWTMTEDILFDNVYLGHSLEDAKTFAAETFHVKKVVDAAAKEAAKAIEEEEAQIIFKEDPVGYIREKVFDFIELAKVDPLSAAKSRPETAAGLGLATITLFGMLGVLVSLLLGPSSKPAAPSKKTDAPTPDDKTKTDSAPVSKAGDEKKQETTVKKRK